MEKSTTSETTDEKWTVEDCRRVWREERLLADMCEEAGYIKQAAMMRGQRYAIDDEENDRLTAKIDAMMIRLTGHT